MADKPYNSDKNNSAKIILTCIGIVVFWSIITLTVVSRLFPFSLRKLSIIFYFSPHYNGFINPFLNELNLYIYIYFIIIESLCTAFFMRKFLFSLNAQNTSRCIVRTILFSTLGVIFLLQTLAQGYYYLLYSQITPMTLRQKNALFSDNSSEMAYRYQQSWPACCSAEIVTDEDFSKAEGMTTHRILSYFLYPIDVRRIRQQPLNCLIYFNKKNAESFIPEDYQIITVYNKENLMAINKKVKNPCLP